MIFHCLSVPYAPTSKEYSLCAFVQKTHKFCNEMTKRGHTVYHYGHADSQVNCAEHITVTNNNILERSYGNLDNWKNNGFNQNVDTEAVKIFNENCAIELNKRIKSKNEFILCWFGYAHKPCVDNFYDKAIVIEPSIGYDSMFAPVKIFETYSQMHKMYAAAKIEFQFGNSFVNYPGFDIDDFEYKKEKSDRALFLGRIIEGKGARLAYEICNTLKQKIDFAGPNILNLKETEYCKFLGTVGPEKRKELLANAKFLFAPSLFIEPCNWSVIEAQLSGTPTITTDVGGFTETVINGATGYRYNNIEVLTYAIQQINKINPENCRKRGLTFSIERQCTDYESIFNLLLNINS